MPLDTPVPLHVCKQEMHTVHTDNLGATQHIAKVEKKKIVSVQVTSLSFPQ